MIKKYLPFLFVLFVAIAIVAIFLSLASTKKHIVTQKANADFSPVQMSAGVYQDSDCGMVIDTLIDVSQVISKSSNSWFFHDHGGMVKWLEDKPFKDDAKIWVMSRDTKRWIDAREAFYSLTDKTPMGYGFGAYEKMQNNFISFDDMRLRVLRGETLQNPLIKKQLIKE